MKKQILLVAVLLSGLSFNGYSQKKISQKQIDALKAEVAQIVQENHKQSQVMVDKIFSFAELGFQEFESSKYLTGILEQNGFTIEMGISGIPTAWVARWSNGEGPVIALGSDVDNIPKASQYPGVAYHKPIVEGAPGHGEGHNAGIPLNITAALAVKQIMERENIGGTLILWPGIAEELVASKAWFTRDGLFEGIDLCIFTHVGNNLGVSYGQASGTGLISVEYTFSGDAAHAAGAPWRGKSAADAVELMNIGWNYKREHLHPLKRSHSVITDGGDQPNVVPSKASIWYYFRDVKYDGIMEMYEQATNIAKGAAMMTETTMDYKVLGTAWPRHFNKVIAETMFANIQKVGLPQWDEKDQELAKAVQKEMGSKETGLPTELDELGLPVTEPRSGGSDDIGDVSWVLPTVTLRFPSNIPGLPGHHWSNAIAMATPIAHKGVTAGAKAEAMTILDFLLKPELVGQAWDYFNNVQTKEEQYKPMITKDDAPPIYLNSEIMKQFRPELEKFYYDETKYGSYLEQLGVTYPTVKKD
ncbi:amidohydrolase [Algoriphagus sp. CAU 1675]|uniref:amidohydrolase n=1 Tax=Algoriphagus sp. CAU 1675 TaxID=3032597 RepID=UPI0023DB6DE3|nr:amidohydrolase [Algoriphagus sp. CAU 1675]MDF2157321.1 amidohydrolase [Algoriphagus sp. CAU 1675]